MKSRKRNKSRKKYRSVLAFLEELRFIARQGLHYTHDDYDRERYSRLLELASIEYEKLCGLPNDVIYERFKKELGHITPKIGVDASIFDEKGRILLIKRSDDRRWCLPGGWADLNETPEQTLAREVLEETGLKVTVHERIDIFTRLPGEYGVPHTSYFLMYHCIVRGGALTTTSEALEVIYYDYKKVSTWHRDHKKRAERAYRFWKSIKGKQ